MIFRKFKKISFYQISQSFFNFTKLIKNKILANKSTILVFIFFAVVTVVYFWPIITNIGTYTDGGDHMFNAWTLARNHQCLLQNACSNYSNANIFFPNIDTMLYSETQFSTGLLTLPLYFINHNPLFATNVWYLLSVFLSGFFMYLLARYLSKGNQAISILAGLLFAFAPAKITAMGHLQNLSIFYLPLIILLLLKYKDSGKKSTIIGFTIACSLLFLASWYQMVFGLIVIGIFILYLLFFKESRTKGVWISVALTIAILSTLPLAKEYVRFSKSNNATFSINNQIEFSASIDDYVTPYENTPLGSVYYKLRPNIKRNSYNPDSFAYAGISLYILFAFSIMGLWWKKGGLYFSRQDKSEVVLIVIVFIAGVLVSLGPVLKIGNHATFPLQGIRVVIPAPYILANIFLPQLSFIRAIGRASVISLFSLCCLIAVVFKGWKPKISKEKRNLITLIIIVVVSLDLLPIKQMITRPFMPQANFRLNWDVPSFYKYVKDNKSINNIIIVRSKKDYAFADVPFAQAEDILWAGYHNKNIFNGYSGFEPPEYRRQLLDFVDLASDDVLKMKNLGLKYYVVDKELSNPSLIQGAGSIFGKPIYEDNRFVMFKI